ncbi:UPF0301 protein [Frankliniella fusca]|uniref:UPF0301 protein n=1 Tax=Frankliniella fusca TaxID=407009 RepID=A0AAE1LFH2_9NEOP|nr:UPF0301 protein [Frankliniella fusca]
MKHTRKYILSHGTHSSICHIQNTPIKHICKGGLKVQVQVHKTVQFIQNTPINHILKGGSRGDQGSSSSPQDKGLYKNHSMHRSKKKKSHAQHDQKKRSHMHNRVSDHFKMHTVKCKTGTL